MPNENERERIKLLRSELRLAGISVKHFFPKWARSKQIRDLIIREVLIALEPPIHEGLIPPYGVIIAPNDEDITPVLPLPAESLEISRKAADGSSALITWKGETFLGLKLLSPTDTPDLQLVLLARELDAIAIRRERNGVVSIYTPNYNFQNIARNWRVSLAVFDAMDRIQRAAPMVDGNTLCALLEFAYYVLSPWRIGATLVWILSDREYVEVNPDLRQLNMDIKPANGEASLGFTAHFLSQYDGATFISKDGKIITTGVHLKPTDKAVELIEPLPGTRHTSACRASFDYDDTLIVTVSADGPVTVFSDGCSIMELWWYSADKMVDVFRKIYNTPADRLYADSRNQKCPRCGKTSQIEIFKLAGWNQRETALCSICKHELDSAHCFNISANIIKVF